MASTCSRSSRSWLTTTSAPRHSRTTSPRRARPRRSRLLVGSSSSRTSGRVRRRPASPSRVHSPPERPATVRSRSIAPRPSRSRRARARSSTSQSSPTVSKCSMAVSPASMAWRATRVRWMPRSSSTREPRRRGRSWGRWASRPCTRTDPDVGVRSPATRRSRVDLPEPLVPTRPVRPVPKVVSTWSSTMVPSGHARDRSRQAMDAVMRVSEGAVGRWRSCHLRHATDRAQGRRGRTSSRRSPLAGTAGPSDLQRTDLHSTEHRG